MSDVSSLISKISRVTCAGVAASALVLSGCATTSGVSTADMTPAQLEMHQRAQAMQRTVWQGAATGALIGIVASVASGGDTRDALQAGLIGGALGYAAGNYLASKQRQFADSEQQIESVTADVRQKNEDAEALISATQLVITEHRASLAQLDAQYRAGLVTEADRRQELTRLADTEAVLAEAIESTSEQLEVYTEVRTHFADAGAKDLSALDEELEYLSAHNEQLAALNDELGATRGV